MGKDLKVCLLLDYYGDLLTTTQREIADLYYNEDLTLSEIAQNNDITRQGVFDSIKRTEEILFKYEDKIGLVKKSQKINEWLKEIEKECKKLEYLSHEEANNIGSRIKKIILSLEELERI